MSYKDDPASLALRTVPFFSELDPLDAYSISQHLIPRRFASGQTIFHHGDPGGLLYIINVGKVKITYATPEGQEALLAILGEGDFFGELALLDDSPRSATAVAIGATETLTLNQEAFMHYIRAIPDFSLHVFKTLAQHIRRLNSQISDNFFLDLPARLARSLLYLAEEHGREVDEGIVIDLHLTQTDLAEMTGATRVSVNRAIGRFRQARWVQTKGRKFIILDRAELLNLIRLSGGFA